MEPPSDRAAARKHRRHQLDADLQKMDAMKEHARRERKEARRVERAKLIADARARSSLSSAAQFDSGTVQRETEAADRQRAAVEDHVVEAAGASAQSGFTVRGQAALVARREEDSQAEVARLRTRYPCRERIGRVFHRLLAVRRGRSGSWSTPCSVLSPIEQYGS